MVAKLYSSSDVGAPQLGETNDGSLMNILRACLIDGYGTRTPAGWTMPFSDIPNKKVVFKPVNDEVYFWLNDNFDYRYAQIRGYTGMTGVDTGTGEFPTAEKLQLPTHVYTCSKRYGTGVGFDNWDMVVDDDWFYFVTHYPASDTYPCGTFFGRMDHADSASTAPWMICGHSVIASQVTSTAAHSIFNDSGYWFVNDNQYLTNKPERLVEKHDITAWVNPNPITGKLEFHKRELSNSAAPYVRYGRRPNLFSGFGVSVDVFVGGDLVTFDGVKYLVCKLVDNIFLIKYDVGVG